MSESTTDRRRSNPLVILIVAVAVLALLTAAGMWVWQNVAGVGDQTQSQSDTYDEAIKSLKLTGDSGDVTITASDTDEIVVDRVLTWTDEKPVSKETVSGDALSIKLTGCPTMSFGFDRCRIDYEIQLPADVALDIQVDSGNVATRGVNESQTLVADSGDITVDKSVGELDLKADSGDIDVNDAAGDLTAYSDSGDVTAVKLNSASASAVADSGSVTLEFAASPESVNAEADSGDITVTVPDDGESYDIKSSTDSGDEEINVDTGSASDRKMTLTADSGNLSVQYR